ncbi:MAG: sulfatase [Opitutia bacterium]
MSRLLPSLALLATSLVAGARPNIVVVLMDDMGWRDTGFAGNRFIETPHLDRFAQEGVRFSQCYASAPNCAPSRACLLTGQYTPRHGVYTVLDERYAPGQPHMRVMSTRGSDELPTRTTNLAEALKAQGYSTALVGMWNLGRGRAGASGSPTGQGFNLYRRPEDLGFAKDAYKDAKGRYLSDALTDEAIAWVGKQKGKPFFLYLADHSVHEPLDPKPELLEKYRRKAAQSGPAAQDPAYAASVEAVDANFGRLMGALGSLGLDRDTLVIFTSDNGGMPGLVAPLRGSKGLLYEGGIRVPGAARWPGVIPAGKVLESPVLGMDFFPTALEAAGVALPKDQPMDGVSLLPALRSGSPLSARPLFWHFPCYIGKGEPMSLMRDGDFKLIHKFAGPTYELYNLREDPSEGRNLAASEPRRLEEMKAKLTAWQRATGAFLADQPNPAYDPKASPPKARRK